MKLRLIGIFFAALAVVCASGCSDALQKQEQQQKAQDDLTEASRYAMIGQNVKAKQFADAAIVADPGDVGVYVDPPEDSDLTGRYSVASVFADVGDDVTEAAYLSQAVAKFPKEYGPLYLLLQIQERTGDAAGQLQTARTLEQMLQARVAKGNLDNGTLLTLADSEWHSGDLKISVSDFRRCMTLFPADDNSWNALAYNYACANDKPNLKMAAIYAGVALSKARQEDAPDDAIGEIEDTLGWVEYREGLYPAAMNDIDQAIDADPRVPEIRYHRAMVYLAQGDRPAAKAELQHALTLDPNYADAKSAMAQLADVVVQTATVQAERDMSLITADSGVDIMSADSPAPAQTVVPKPQLPQPKSKGNP